MSARDRLTTPPRVELDRRLREADQCDTCNPADGEDPRCEIHGSDQ